MANSSIPNFHEKSREERIKAVALFSGLSKKDIEVLKNGGISFNEANNMVENAIGTISSPLGIATNFRINGKDYLIPMSIEEPSIIAAASKAAKIAKTKGGFTMTADTPYSIGQIQVVGVNKMKFAISKIMRSKKEILKLANSKSKTLSKMGKGAKQVTCKKIKSGSKIMLIVELLIDVGDAMGANITNTMCEGVAPLIEKLTGGRIVLRILSNYSTKRLVRGKAIFDKKELGGQGTVDNIILAYQFAANDPYRAVTHNKGIMNGIIAVANATGQDTRAIEAAAHAYASRKGRYNSLTEWKKNKDGNLIGRIELPMSVGIVGGIVNTHPIIKLCTKILGIKSAKELACIIAAVGLAQNLSAIRALASEGIQKGHMKLHAKNIATSAGVTLDKINEVTELMIKEGNVSVHRAKEILKEL
jgi:hydroxymethylglutaryl-CoA reductase